MSNETTPDKPKGRPLKPDSLRGLLDAAIAELDRYGAAGVKIDDPLALERLSGLLKAARKKVR